MSCGNEWKDDRATSRLKEWILRALGCDVISVELSDEQLNDCVDEAQNYWQMWVGNVKAITLTLTSSLEYPSISIAEDVDSVVDVIFDNTSDGFRNLWGWAGVEIDPVQYLYGHGNGYGRNVGYGNGNSALTQYMMHLEDAQRIVSADRDWQWDKARRTLVIWPGTNSSKMMVFYLSRCFDYLTLSTYEWTTFREYCLGKAMMKLGQIRMKYQDLPSASGSFTLDGESLYANGEAKLLQLEEKMRLMQRPCGIIVG
jgi:hypothetical protein